MALLSSVASAATARVAAAPCTRIWRHGEAGLCAPGVGGAVRGLKCRAQAEAIAETAADAAERPLWLPGSTPPAYLDGT
jgi:hypothetical protein